MVVVTIDHSAAPRNVATKIEIITMDQVKLRNRRMTIGKIDLSTGQSVYKPEYLARMAVTGARAGRVHSNFYSFGKFHVIQFSQ
ncbi:MAG: hypothetical protein E6Y08_10965 [Paenibacillus sp.]|uniref:hypothetical protein n=1 Tax=Paenibacillus sp. TaxID=58172 RepID=UPI002911F173|nr:hypothetical protein [Paenibacillus sp.]MDU4696328.1 hypothetical protein [Paenibacillus sp.]